jgi:hypothetical protein
MGGGAPSAQKGYGSGMSQETGGPEIGGGDQGDIMPVKRPTNATHQRMGASPQHMMRSSHPLMPQQQAKLGDGKFVHLLSPEESARLVRKCNFYQLFLRSHITH